MSDELYVAGPRVPGGYQDFSVPMNEFIAESNSPAGQARFAEDEAQFNSPEARARLNALDNPVQDSGIQVQSLRTVEDPETLRNLEEVIARSTPKELLASRDPANGVDPMHDDSSALLDSLKNPKQSADSSSAGSTEGATGAPAGSKSARKPSELESTLASIRLSPARQNKLVITGDENVLRRFYDKLESKGLLHYQGGSPIISASAAKSIQYLNEANREVHKVDAVKVADLKFSRESLNPFKRDHNLTVLVTGSSADMATKSGEFTKFLVDSREGKSDTKEGKQELKVDSTGKSTSSSSLYDFISTAKDTVSAHASQEQAKEDTRKAFRNEAEDGKIAKASGGAAEAGAESGTATKAVAANVFAQGIANDLQKAYSSVDGLMEKSAKTDKGEQLLTVSALSKIGNLKDPVSAELSTLDKDTRQAALVNLSATVAKVDDKEIRSVKVDSSRGGNVSLREKLNDLIGQEIVRDPSFGAKAAEILKGMPEGVVTEAQSKAVLANLGAQAERVGVTPTALSVEAPTTSATATATTTSTATAATNQATSANTAAAPAGPTAAYDMGQSVRELLMHEKASGPAISGNVVSNIFIELQDVAGKPLADLDNSKGSGPTETLNKLEALVQGSLTDKIPNAPDTKDLAAELVDQMKTWRAEDNARVAYESGGSKAVDSTSSEATTEQSASTSTARSGLAQATVEAAEAKSSSASQTATESKSTATQSTVATATTEASSASASESKGASVSATAGPTQATASGSVSSSEQEASSRRFGETESAAGKLSAMMANPAGSFTDRDKSWNAKNVDAAANAVLKLDPESVSKMSPSSQAQVAVYAKWVALNASTEKLPGFDSPGGQEKARELVSRANSLTGALSGPISDAVAKNVDKAERMVGEMGRRENTAQLSGQDSFDKGRQSTSGKQADSSGYAKDLVHAVYKGGDLSEATAKYLLKSSGQLTPDSMKNMSPELKAQTVVGLAHLAKEVREGAMGDFAKLSSGVKNNVIGAQQVADRLQNSMERDPSMSTALIKAHMDLPAAASAAAEMKGADMGGSSLKGADASKGADMGGSSTKVADASKTIDAGGSSDTKIKGDSVSTKATGRDMER